MQKFIRKLTHFFRPGSVQLEQHGSAHPMQTVPQRIGRDHHNVSRKMIDKSALDVLYGLKRAGFEAYLVGGGVRDLLLGLEPKDFDIVTNAKPDEVKAIFKHRCQLIGRRFRLAHVRFGRQVIEVATFRGDENNGDRQVDASGRLIRDNIYGSLEEDIWRRDFTVNALYYDIRDFTLVDFAGSMADIEQGTLRLIGDPQARYREDPVRMIRAVRFASKLGFNIEPQTEAPLFELGVLLEDVSHARMFEEVLKLFHSGTAIEVFEKLRHYDLFKHVFPLTDQSLATESEHFPKQFVIEALKSTDQRIQDGKPVNPAFLFAAFLWDPLMSRRRFHKDQGLNDQDALFAAANDVLSQQVKRTAIPKRISAQMRDIWSLQFRLHRRQGARAQQLRAHPRFRAAYDFIGIRVAAGETELQELFDWWTLYQEKDPIDQVAFANELEAVVKKGRKRRRKPNRNFYRRDQKDES